MVNEKNINSFIFTRMITNRYVPSPKDESWSKHERESKDGTKVFLRVLRHDENAQGTIIFVLVPGFTHYPPGPTVMDWDGFFPLLHEFLERQQALKPLPCNT
jgi:hypothetical protein